MSIKEPKTKPAAKPRAPAKPRAATKPAIAKPKPAKAEVPAPVTAPAPAPRALPVAPTLVTTQVPVVARAPLGRKDLVKAVTDRTGLKKKEVKPALEAAMAILGEALAEGRELNLIPFGKLKVTRLQDKANARVIVCRVRQPTGKSGDAGDDDDDMGGDA